MLVHRPFDLAFGLFVTAGSLVILCGSLYESWKCRRFPLATKRLFVTGIVYMALGAYNLSEAFDWSHQTSHRTSLIEWFGLPIVFVGLALIMVLQRAEKKAEADVGTTTSGEHTT